MNMMVRNLPEWLLPGLLMVLGVLVLVMLIPLVWAQIWGQWEYARCALGWHQRVEDTECLICGEREVEVEEGE